MSRPLLARIERSAFLSNIAHLQSLAPESELVLVVKANAYGHGIAGLVNQLSGHRVAVASSEEARELFDLGYQGEVILLEGAFNKACIESLAAHQVCYVVHSVEQLELLIAQEYQGKIWLKLDTGMHRLGLTESALADCLSRLSSQSAIHVETMMTHFSSADDRRNGSFNSQLALFNRMVKHFDLEHLPQSLCNSAALLLHTECHQQIARPGIALYGSNPAPLISSLADSLVAVMTLRSEVIALRQIDAGETVGYGDTWTATQSSTIATVAVGYGDGYPRHAVSGTPVLVEGQRASLAGRVSMDMISVDVTGLSNVRIGSEVELWGKNLSVDEVASSAGTISYELTTGLTARVPRHFY